MSFVLVIIILGWTLGWPLLMYLYFSHQTHEPPPALPDVIDLDYRRVEIGPIVEGDTILLKLKINDTTYILDDADTRDLVTSLKRAQMTVKTMNEVQALN